MGRQWRRLAVGGNLARRPQVHRTQRLADADFDHELLASGDSDAGNGAEELVHADLAGARGSLGRATGFEDETQGTLFFDVCRILAEKRPRAFFLENVKNLASHDKARTFEVIMSAIDRCPDPGLPRRRR